MGRSARWSFSALVVWGLVIVLLAATAVPLSAVAAVSVGPPRPARLTTLPGAALPLRMVAGTARVISGDDVFLSRIAANLTFAIEKVDAFWGAGWSHDVVIVATDSPRQFMALAAGRTDSSGQAAWADIAAVTLADRTDPVRRAAVGQRIVFAPGAAQMSEPALRIVLAHELFHYAAWVDTALDAPRWLLEGVADFVARPQVGVVDAALPAALPSDGELDTPGPSRTQGYDQAWWFARYVAERYGTATLRRLYYAACGVGHADLAGAIHAVLGVDSGTVFTQWRHWLAQHAAPGIASRS